jgi:hypothetical protein
MMKSTAEALQTGSAGSKADDEARAAAAGLERLYDAYTGAANRPERSRVALGFSIFRSQQVAAKLGSAMLSVGGDFGTMAQTARFNGIPAGKVLARYASMMNPANAEDRLWAARHVMIADQWADGHAAQWRMLGEELAHEGARRMASGVLRASGLTAHTDIARQAFGMELVNHVTLMRARAFGALDPAFQRMLQRYGIAEGRWDALRAVTPEQDGGFDWLYPQTVAAAGDQQLADDFMRMIVAEADYAVPMPDLRTRATIASVGSSAPQFVREIVKSAFLFKGFPLTIMSMHGRRMLDEGASRGEVGRAMAGLFIARYGIGLLGLTTIGGALSLQVKELAKGRDPQDMTTARFWTKAGLQGGGLGIFGDLIASNENRFGGGTAQTLVGQMGQTFDNAWDLTGGNAIAALDGDEATEANVGKDMVKLLSSETPGVSLWYTRLALERLVIDRAREWADPDYGDAYARLDRYAEEQGTAYFAPPGSRADWRAPDWGNGVGQPSPN